MAGKLKLVDFEKNRVLWREEPFQKDGVIYSLDWSSNGVMAACGAFKAILLKRFDKE